MREDDYITILVRIGLALLAGMVVGLERAHHGRPAGLRTHTLVCAASCLLMLFTVLQIQLFDDKVISALRIDPTRMGQGIMTGIGFLGAGVIMKDKLTIRGLTTAASIWMTASIGIMVGMGIYFAAFVATVATFVVLSMFRWLERIMPSLHYGRLVLRFKGSDIMEKEELFSIIEQCNISSYPPAFSQEEEGRSFSYEMTIRTANTDNFTHLSDTLRQNERVKEFSLLPTGD